MSPANYGLVTFVLGVLLGWVVCRIALSFGDRRHASHLYRVGSEAKLPSGYQWGADAMEQFQVGKLMATLAILKELTR